MVDFEFIHVRHCKCNDVYLDQFPKLKQQLTADFGQQSADQRLPAGSCLEWLTFPGAGWPGEYKSYPLLKLWRRANRAKENLGNWDSITSDFPEVKSLIHDNEDASKNLCIGMLNSHVGKQLDHSFLTFKKVEGNKSLFVLHAPNRQGPLAELCLEGDKHLLIVRSVLDARALRDSEKEHNRRNQRIYEEKRQRLAYLLLTGENINYLPGMKRGVVWGPENPNYIPPVAVIGVLTATGLSKEEAINLVEKSLTKIGVLVGKQFILNLKNGVEVKS